MTRPVASNRREFLGALSALAAASWGCSNAERARTPAGERGPGGTSARDSADGDPGHGAETPRASDGAPAETQATSTNRNEETSMASTPRASSRRMPTVFAAHGAPILLDDAVWTSELAAWARAMPKPTSVLMVSAHWEAKPTALGATTSVPLVYDFYGFPERYYRTKYPSPGAPALAKRVRELFDARSIPHVDEPARGLDHGAYVPLVAMYPAADVPVLQVSLPALEPEALVAMGRALAPLRDEGVLIFGSGFLTHNMSYAFRPGVPTWAREFDQWAAEALARRDLDALQDFDRRAPAARTALPTWEHYAPVLVAAAAADDHAAVSFPITGFWMDGAFTKRSVQFG